MRRYYTNPDTGTEVTLEGVQVRATTRDGQTHAWRVNPGGRGPVWLLTNGAGDVLPGRPEAAGQLLTDLRTTYELAHRHAVPVRNSHRRQLRSLAFEVAELDGLTARDVARELAEMFGWRVDDGALADAELRQAAADLGIDLPGPAEDNSPGMPAAFACQVDESAGVAEQLAADCAASADEVELGGPTLPGATAMGRIERVTCADVRPGDYVARVKRGPFHQVTDVSWGASSAWLTFAHTARIRPHRSAKLWRFVPAEVSA